MRRTKKILLLAVLCLIAGSAAVYAYNALSVTTTLTIKEPLVIATAGGSLGTAPVEPFSCTIDASKTTATCTGSAYAGESGTINLQIWNYASVGISTTLSATSSSSGVTLTLPTTNPITIPAAVLTPYPGPGVLYTGLSVDVSPSAAPGIVTITITISR